MDASYKQVLDILREHGAVLDRKRKHQVYKFPDGRIFVLGTSPSDRRSGQNSLAILQTFLGLKGERGAAGERRERKVPAPTPLRRAELTDLTTSSLRDALVKVKPAVPAPVKPPKKSKPKYVPSGLPPVDVSALLTKW